MSARFEQRGAGVDHGRRIRHVFEHFHAGHHVKAGGRFGSKVFDGDTPVIDLLSGFEQVQLRHFQRFVRKINAGDPGAADSHGFSEYAATAADVEHGFALQRGDAVDVVEP